MLSYFYHMIEFDHDHSEFIYHEMFLLISSMFTHH